MSPVVRTVIFSVFVLGFWTVAVPYFVLSSGTRPDLRGAGAGGWLLIAAGIGLYLTCAFWGFALRGRGTPLPLDPPKKLVVDGPYGVVRNPLYWSFVFMMLGDAAVFHSQALVDCAIMYFAVASLFVLIFEEPELKWKFGAEYEEYCQRVPRWLPRLRRK